MMRLVCIFILFPAFILGQQKGALVRYDGLYQTARDKDSTDHTGTTNYLRFYPNGKVISVCAEGTVSDVKKWFNINHKDISRGDFEITGQRIYFSTTSSEGTVVYDGVIVGNYYLELNSKSLINDYATKEKYFFIKIPGLK